MENSLDGFTGGGATSQIGQGMAYVLPETRSDKYFLQIALDERNKVYQDRVKREQQLKDREEKINIRLTKEYGQPDAWQPFNEAVGKGWNEWTQEAIQLKIKGIDPTTDPTMLEKYSKLKGIATYANEIKGDYINNRKAIETNPDKFNPNALENLESQYKDALANPEKWHESGNRFSSPEPKGANLADLINKELKPISFSSDDGNVSRKGGNLEANKGQIQSVLMGDPDRWAKSIMRRFGADITKLPYQFKGGVPADEATIKIVAEGIINDPERREQEMLEHGIPERDTANEELYEAILRTNKGWDEVVNTLGEELNNRQDSVQKKVFGNENNARAQRAEGRAVASHNLAERKEERQAGKELAAKEQGKSDQKYGDVLTTNLQSKNKKAIEDLDRSFGSKGTVFIEKDDLVIQKGSDNVFNRISGKNYKIPLKDTERIKAFIREAMPSGQYNSIINDDVYTKEASPFINSSKGLLPNNTKDNKMEAKYLKEEFGY